MVNGFTTTLDTTYSMPFELMLVMARCFFSTSLSTSFPFNDRDDFIGVVGVDRGSAFVDFEKPKANECFEGFFRESAFSSGKVQERQPERWGELVGNFLGCHG